MINYKLALEIYTRPWYMNELMCQNYERILEIVKGSNEGLEKLNSTFNESKPNKEAGGVKNYAVYNFDSVITKSGGLSHNGTEKIAQIFKENDNNKEINGHLFIIDSGGGSADAVHYLRKYTQKGKRKKPLVAYVKDTMCSAALYIGMDADYIIASNEFACIGSIGTMVSFEGYANGEKDSNGKKHFRVYAAKSFNKNGKYEEAINNDNTQGIIDYLNPFNERFINDVKAARPNITEEQTTGMDYDAKDCIGTLIDEIGDINLAYKKLDELTKSNTKNKMEKTNEQLIQEAYNKGMDDGIKKESNRVGAWLVWQNVDPEMVQKGIDSGEEIDTKTTQQLLLKNSLKNRVEDLNKSNTQILETDPVVKTPQNIKSETEKYLQEKYKI